MSSTKKEAEEKSMETKEETMETKEIEATVNGDGQVVEVQKKSLLQKGKETAGKAWGWTKKNWKTVVVSAAAGGAIVFGGLMAIAKNSGESDTDLDEDDSDDTYDTEYEEDEEVEQGEL